MSDKKTKINNSYESEPSSGSGSLLGESDAFENVSFNESLTKLTDFLKPQYQRMDVSETIQKSDEIFNEAPIKKLILKINKHAVHSSQESEFEGYPEEDINTSNNSILDDSKENNFHDSSNIIEYIPNVIDTNYQLKTAVIRLNKVAVHSSQESDFEGYKDEELFSNDAATIKINQKTPEDMVKSNELIGNRSSEENSCNAVDMKLSNESPKCNKDLIDLSFNGKIKELCSNNNQNVITHETTNTFMYTNEKSPDLFADDEYTEVGEEEETKVTTCPDQIIETSFEDISMLSNVRKKEKILLRKIQKSLSGVPPPPSVTILQLDMFKKLSECKEKIFNFIDSPLKADCEKEVLFKPSHDMEEVLSMEWPNILNVNQHGISYNLSETSEKIELLCMSVAERYIGVETSSSFMNNLSPSSAKKRIARLKMLTKSPGSRLSHLAKRRAVFSSANLQSTAQKPSAPKVCNREILLDLKKSENRKKLKIATPKRRTPGRRKSFVRKTPTSSARKKLFLAEAPKPGPSRETSKRALFKSPPKEKIVPKIAINPEIANRVEKSKRALFSPVKSYSANSQDSSTLSFRQCDTLGINDSSLTSEISFKRKRCEDYVIGNSQKIFKTNSNDGNLNMENLTPRTLKIKSQSFCIGAGTTRIPSGISGKSLFRASSDTKFYSSQLSESHKKKLLWAVSQALQSKQIGVGHTSFKQYASVLARIVKRLFLETSDKSGSTSDKMLRFAKKYVFWVLQGKTADEIYISEKNRLNQEKHMISKVTGYITPEDYENRKNLIKKSTSDLLFSEHSVDSFNISQSISQENIISQDIFNTNRQPIQINPSLNNSSSKNNLHGIALRENVDSELRRSAQKNFTGKDQKNVSPYSEKPRSSLKKFNSTIFDVNAMKAKRQISFDN